MGRAAVWSGTQLAMFRVELGLDCAIRVLECVDVGVKKISL